MLSQPQTWLERRWRRLHEKDRVADVLARVVIRIRGDVDTAQLVAAYRELLRTGAKSHALHPAITGHLTQYPHLFRDAKLDPGEVAATPFGSPIPTASREAEAMALARTVSPAKRKPTDDPLLRGIVIELSHSDRLLVLTAPPNITNIAALATLALELIQARLTCPESARGAPEHPRHLDASVPTPPPTRTYS